MKIQTLRTLFEYVLVTCIILEFNTAYMSLLLIRRVVQILPMFILLGLIMMTSRKISRKMAICLILYFMGAIFPMLNLTDEAYVGYIKNYVIILPLAWIYLAKRRSEAVGYSSSVFFRYSNTLVILAMVSIVMWLLCSLLQIIPMTGLFPYAWGENLSFVPSYYNIYFETQKVIFSGESIWRNSGIFCEGPMYNMPLCVALAIEYFMRPKRSKIKITILIVTIISTLTTTGQIFILGLLAWHLVRNITSKYKPLIVVMIPLFFIGLLLIVSTMLDYKNEMGGENSVNERARDIEYCIEAGMENPIFGIGIVQKGDVTTWRGYSLGTSNSLFGVFASGGLYMLALYLGVLVMIPLLYCKIHGQSNWLMVMLCFFGLFVITNCFLKYLTLMFMAWGLSRIDLICRWPRQKGA